MPFGQSVGLTSIPVTVVVVATIRCSLPLVRFLGLVERLVAPVSVLVTYHRQRSVTTVAEKLCRTDQTQSCSRYWWLAVVRWVPRCSVELHSGIHSCSD